MVRSLSPARNLLFPITPVSLITSRDWLLNFISCLKTVSLNITINPLWHSALGMGCSREPKAKPVQGLNTMRLCWRPRDRQTRGEGRVPVRFPLSLQPP